MRQELRPSKERCPVCDRTEVERFCHAFDRYYGSPDRTWLILRCRDCGFGWTYPPLADDEIAGYYPEWYMGNTQQTIDEFLRGDLTKTRSWRNETEKVNQVEKFKQGGRILDVGCGDGKFLWGLDKTRWDSVGVERGQEIVTLVRAHFPETQWIVGDIYSTELAPESFDAITFWHVLEHLPHPRKVLMRVHQLLKPDGVLVVSLPNLESLQARLFKRHWFAFDEVPRHLFHYSPESLMTLMQETGYRFLERSLSSPNINFHSLKHSLIHWSEEKFANRVPYYLLKPLLFPVQALERLTGKYGMLSMTAAKAG